MAIFSKMRRFNLWLHAFLVIAMMYVLVGLNGYRILLAVPFLLIHGTGDGYPPIEWKTLGVALIIVSSILILLIAGFAIWLFARLFTDKTRSLTFKILFVCSLLIIFFGIYFKEWISNANDRVYDAIFTGNISAYENAIKWRKNGNINDDLYCAARDGQLQMVKYLISKGANPNAKLGGSGDSVLAGAIPNVLNKPDGNKPVIEYLKDHGATN
jgi:hypothetical protein